MLTPFGRMVRKLRIDKGVRLKDMADYLDVPSSFLSAIENGRKQIPDSMIDGVHEYFEGQGISKSEWLTLASNSVTRLTVDLTDYSEQDREDTLAFGRKFKNLPADRKKLIRDILED